MIDVAKASTDVRAAKDPEDVFGERATFDTVNADFRKLAAALHPDRHGASRQAHDVFVKLGQLKDGALKKLAGGIYGMRGECVPPPAPPAGNVDVKVRGKSYRVKERQFAGDICDLYACEHAGSETLFKVAQSAADNDLVENEAAVLSKLYPAGQAEEKFYRYLPKLADHFMLRGSTKTNRKVVVLPWFTEHVSLAEVARAYPKGIDFRDAVWMFKRLLAALGFVHRQGFIHGAVLPQHVLVHPVNHGARLIDWCYAGRAGTKVRAMVRAQHVLYAPEVPKGQTASPATDIYMAAQCFMQLVGIHEMPAALRTFVTGCLLQTPSRRPEDAWALHQELDELLLRVVGPRAYRPFHMPGAR